MNSVRDQIVQLIIAACKESSAGRSNGCLALMGLAGAVENVRKNKNLVSEVWFLS